MKENQKHLKMQRINPVFAKPNWKPSKKNGLINIHTFESVMSLDLKCRSIIIGQGNRPPLVCFKPSHIINNY